MKRGNKLILEFTEFNLQRFNDTSAQPAAHVDDPSLSTNAFDKHQDAIRAAMSRLDDIMHRLGGTSVYKNLRSKLALEKQDVKNLVIQRIVKINSISYNAYISFVVDGEQYWGVVENITGTDPVMKSEVFKDQSLYQATEWVIKIKGIIIKAIKDWLKPEPGMYKLLEDDIYCYSVETGKQLEMKSGIEIELIRSHANYILVEYSGDKYELKGDNYIYFNWWFEKID
jgi:hypothetical protein